MVDDENAGSRRHSRGHRRRAASTVVASLGLALLCAGCSTAEQPDPTEAWVRDLCTITAPLADAPPPRPAPDYQSLPTNDAIADAYVAWRREVDPPWVATRERWLRWAQSPVPRPDLEPGRRSVIASTQLVTLNTGSGDPAQDVGVLRTNPLRPFQAPRELALVVVRNDRSGADPERRLTEQLRSAISADRVLADAARAAPECRPFTA